MESSTSRAAFEAFAVDASIAGAAVRVILDRGVSIVDDIGSTSRIRNVLHFWKPTMPTWADGTAVVIDAETFKLREVIEDDGYIIKIEAT